MVIKNRDGSEQIALYEEGKFKEWVSKDGKIDAAKTAVVKAPATAPKKKKGCMCC